MPGPVIICDYDPRWPALYEEKRGQEYAALKRRLAATYGSDHMGYTEAKGDLICLVVAQARVERTPC